MKQIQKEEETERQNVKNMTKEGKGEREGEGKG